MAIFQDNRELLRRLTWLRVLFIAVFVLLAVKLWFLAVLQFEYYRSLAERNRVRTFPELAPRGLIYDRDGRVLVDNVYGFNLLLFRDEVEDLTETFRFLVRGLELTEDTIQERLKASGNYSIYQPVVIKENLSMQETAYILAHQTEHPEIRIFKQPRRIYRYGSLAAHLLGYVGEISPVQLQQAEFTGRKPGELVGQYGVERTYNSILTGRDGWRRVLVDSRGRVLEELERLDAFLGHELTLTIDLDLQVAAEAQLGDSPGAIVVLAPRTGEILAMTSHPAFDPNQFAVRISHKQWNRLLENPDDPLQHRALQSTFSPGSIFKVVMALAGLERGVVDDDTSVYCRGSVELYGNRFRCWKPEGHGRVSIRDAIRQSCNVYFYLLGQKLGIQDIADFSHRVGLGVPTGIELSGEVGGLVPSEEWKRNERGEPWYPGETISVAIGQGPLLVTPMQLARMIGIVATGEAPDMRLLRKPVLEESNRRPVHFEEPDFSPNHLAIVRDAMWSVVNSGGTGRAARVADFQVCGKTGTAQTISTAAHERLSDEVAKKYTPHAWFVGFAPRDNPEVVVVVIVQRGGSGGSAAAPIAGEILKLYSEKYRDGRLRNLEVVSHAPDGERL